MSVGRVGGVLLFGGCVFLLAAVAMALGGAAVGLGGSGPGTFAAVGAIGLFGAGATVLGAGGQPPLTGPATRIGLALLGLGLISLVGSQAVSSTLRYDPLESWPVVALGLGGGLAAFFGWLLTGAALVRAGGSARTVGALFLGGVLLFGLSPVLGNTEPRAISSALALLGAVAVLLGIGGLGVLGFQAPRPSLAAGR